MIQFVRKSSFPKYVVLSAARGKSGQLTLGFPQVAHLSTRDPTVVEKIALSVRAAIGAISDPHLRGDQVAVLGETTGHISLKHLHSKMKSDSVGQRILEEKPILNFSEEYVQDLEKLGPHTVGGSFAYMMKLHGLTIGERPAVKYIGDPDLAYVMRRYRETHDLVHSILGLPISVAGEVGAKWFEMVQTGLPMTALAAFMGPLRMERGEHSFGEEYIDYSTRAAQQCEPFINIYFEQHWEEPLVDFRRRVNLPEFPEGVARLDHPSLSEDPHLSATLLINHYQDAISHLGGTGIDSDVDERACVFTAAIKHLQADLWRGQCKLACEFSGLRDMFVFMFFTPVLVHGLGGETDAKLSGPIIGLYSCHVAGPMHRTNQLLHWCSEYS